ncbi:YbaK/EbsC family protein [Thalassomonas viridans]|uniref:YbaK/EbsC family protein n=1 Tax=Thalassomonas viridans TaxID=137584 RepID=A0AAF0CE43_9GAMM|nr:YbaK/EbsC family protein [Thalassomonas viridans]WDE09000.1 YbaK/EbsC family protein [Thalassomonas viridans]
MAIAITLKEYLDKNNTHYDFIKHRTTVTALDSSRAAHLPASKVSKAVILESDNGEYLMASLPANSRLSLNEVYNLTGHHYRLVSEEKLLDLFPDCAVGAIPAMGNPYRMKMLVDDSLLEAEDVYIECGDHKNLLKLEHHDYAHLVAKMNHGNIRGANLGAPRIWERTGRDWSM